MNYEITATRGFQGPAETRVYFHQYPNQTAQFAFQLMLAPGVLVVGPHDGEDSAGRAKARPFTPDELAARCFDLAEAAYKAATERGLMIDLPTLDEADELAKSRNDKN